MLRWIALDTESAPSFVDTYIVALSALAPRVGNGPGRELASTGSDPTVPLGIAGALLAAGTALTVVARHRRRVGRA